MWASNEETLASKCWIEWLLLLYEGELIRRECKLSFIVSYKLVIFEEDICLFVIECIFEFVLIELIIQQSNIVIVINISQVLVRFVFIS